MDKVAVIGLGYVGLPLAVEFGRVMEVVGFDTNSTRVEELNRFVDRTGEVDENELRSATKLKITSEAERLKVANIYIVTVPTPVDEYKQPDLSPLRSATQTVGKFLKKGDVVIYESTVFPGCTEEVCVPILEQVSGHKFNVDFFCGYSPERINPGDKTHRLPDIKKVVSGSNAATADKIDLLYQRIIKAGTHKASSIKVAEAAKVIENSQRDLNIAFVNELALIFDRMGIDTHEVLQAASTKWNFLKFTPGLVGGHCIGVDPYYLTHKAEGLGYRPEVILAGRRINDNMGVFIANKVIKLMARHECPIHKARILVLGVTFKENCGDIRNSKVIDLINELKSFCAEVDVYDPIANASEVLHEYGLKMVGQLTGSYDAIVHAVSHAIFQGLNWNALKGKNTVVYDVKGVLDRAIITERL